LLMLLYPLSDEKRDIVLLSYLLDMTDQEIANKLNIVRRTVQYKRTNSLKEMKRRMEVLEYGKKFD
jgi:DNA-directed RNA polymerase specialized sigma24 family protein